MTTTTITTDALRFHGDAEVGPGLVDLAVNVRPGAPPQWLRERIAAADLAAYPDQTAARRAVAERHGRAEDEVLLTAGAAEAFVLLARALRPAKAVVVHPQFTEPEAALRAAGHPVAQVVLPPPFVLDPELIPADADLVVVGNPTNPTSVLHSRATLKDLATPGRLLVVDEAFADCVPGETESLAADPDVVVIRSLTKTWGLAGLRAGYVLGPADVIAALREAQPLWAVSAPALAATVACCEPRALDEAMEWATALADERTHLTDRLAPFAEVVPGAAASFVLARTPVPVREALRERGLAVRRGETFPGLDEHWLRIAVRDRTTTDRLITALREVLS